MIRAESAGTNSIGKPNPNCIRVSFSELWADRGFAAAFDSLAKLNIVRKNPCISLPIKYTSSVKSDD